MIGTVNVAAKNMVAAAASGDNDAAMEAKKQALTTMKALQKDMLEHLAEEEDVLPPALEELGYSEKEFYKWAMKKAGPVEMKVGSKLNGGTLGHMKVDGACTLILLSSMTVWMGPEDTKRFIKSVGLPQVIIKPFKKCLEYRWVEPLKIITAA